MLTALRRARRSMPLGLRADAVELLDGDSLSPPQIDRNLADLARLNRLPGGTRASIEGVHRLLDGPDEPHVLDVGTGSADLPIAFTRLGWLATAVDVHPTVIAVARRETARQPRIEIIEADARALPFADGEFDVSHCSLLIHHFEPDAAVAALREMQRVARRGIVVNDLRRGIVPLLATAVSVATLARSRVTRNDGLLSARRAYTLAELDELLDAGGLAVRWRSPAWMPRVVTAAIPKVNR